MLVLYLTGNNGIGDRQNYDYKSIKNRILSDFVRVLIIFNNRVRQDKIVCCCLLYVRKELCPANRSIRYRDRPALELPIKFTFLNYSAV